MKNSNKTQVNMDELTLDTNYLAKVLRVGTQTSRQYMRSKELRGMKIGRCWYTSEKWLQEFLSKRVNDATSSSASPSASD